MNDEKNISGLIHHLSRQLTGLANQKWAAIGYPDIRTTHVSILIRIASKENNHSKIAQQLGISRQAISRLNSELIKGGYLQTQPDEQNKKAETLSVTQKGWQFLLDFEKANLDLEKAFIEILGTDDFDCFKRALLKLDERIKK